MLWVLDKQANFLLKVIYVYSNFLQSALKQEGFTPVKVFVSVRKGEKAVTK